MSQRENYYLLPPKAARKVVKSVRDKSLQTKLQHDSVSSCREIANENATFVQLAKFFKSEIVLGSHLARGTFSDIYEVKEFSLKKKLSSENFSCNEHISRINIVQESIKNMTISDDDGRETSNSISKNSRFVVKHVKKELVFNTDEFHDAAIGLANEVNLLSSLQHPNIVTLRGISAHGPAGYARGHHDGYFLVFDRLYETLEDKIKIWQKKQKQNRLQVIPIRIHGRYKNDLILQRLKVLTDISDALTYLHDKRIIHRDLKPSNFAFDANGNIKIIDFGLSRILPSSTTNNTESSRPNQDETYHLTGNTGTMRYMAPEVALSKPYNAKADVYSFAMISYTVMTLRKPYDGYSMTKMKDEVFLQAKRPSFLFSPLTLPGDIRKLIEAGWSQQHATRSTIKAMYHSLKHILRREEQKVLLPSVCTSTSSNNILNKMKDLPKGWPFVGLSTKRKWQRSCFLSECH